MYFYETSEKTSSKQKAATEDDDDDDDDVDGGVNDGLLRLSLCHCTDTLAGVLFSWFWFFLRIQWMKIKFKLI